MVLHRFLGPFNEIAEAVAAVSASDTNALVDEYYDKYDICLEEKNYQAIVTHFGDLGALKQLPGLAINIRDFKRDLALGNAIYK